MSNLIGQSLGRYHILEQLGEGGMARTDLTCLIRAVINQGHDVDMSCVWSDFRGDMSGLCFGGQYV